MGFYPMAVSLLQHTNTHITQNNTTKNKKKQKQKERTQMSSQSYTNSGRITANEYSVEKEKK
jgi:hypothetical protein